MSVRETIYQALFALGASISWTNPNTGTTDAFAFSARRVYLWENLSGKLPALCQAEPKETTRQQLGMPQKRVFTATWLIFWTVAETDPSPGSTANAILDQVDALFPDFDSESPYQGFNMQTLGGLVTKVSIDGDTRRFQGDLTGQGLIVVPLRISVP